MRRATVLALSVWFCVATLASPASACDYCMPVVGANPLSWENYFSLYSHELYMGTYHTGWGTTQNPPDNEVDNHLTNELTYSTSLFNSHFVLAFTLLVMYQHMSVGSGSNLTTVSSYGIGDLYVFPGYMILHSLSKHLMVSAVIKAPTGQTNIQDNHGATADPDFQLGSGSWDLGGQVQAQFTLLGGQIAGTFMAKKDFNGTFLAGNPDGSALIHSYNYEGMLDFNYSHRLVGNQAGRAMLIGELGLDMGFLGPEIYNGVAQTGPQPANSAGGAFYGLLAPGLEVLFPRINLSAEAVVQAPIFAYWTGTQLGYTIEGFLGVRYVYR